MRRRVQAALIESLYILFLLPALPLILFVSYFTYVTLVIIWIFLEWLLISEIDKRLDERNGR